MLRRWSRRALRVLAVALLLVAGYVGYATFRAHQPVTLPSVAGPHPVGRRTLELEVRARRESVWIWYPATRSGPRARYAPGAWAGLHLPSPVGWGETGFDEISVRSRLGVPPLPRRSPLVVLLPGLGLAAPQYQTLAESLVARGFVVAGVTPTGSANLTVLHGRAVRADRRGNPSGFGGGHGAADQATGDRLVRAWVDDATSAVRQLRQGSWGRRLTASTAYVGHSFGGAAALQACAEDQRCFAGVDLDGAQYGAVVRRGLRVPMLLAAHEGACVSGVCRARDAADRTDRQLARRLAAAGTGAAWSWTIAGTQHLGFSDYAVYYLARPLTALITLGSQDGPRRLQAIATTIGSFLASSVHGGSGFDPGAPASVGHVVRLR